MLLNRQCILSYFSSFPSLETFFPFYIIQLLICFLFLDTRWVPNSCGQLNMYMQGFKCIVTGSSSTKTLQVAKPPVYCGDDQSKCLRGAKQMIFTRQLDGNNVHNPPKVPTYNISMGFSDGAQNDIFQ